MAYVSVVFLTNGKPGRKEYLYTTDLDMKIGGVYDIVVDGFQTYDNPVQVIELDCIEDSPRYVKTITSATKVNTPKNNNKRGMKNMQNFGKMFSKVKPGMCRLSMNGVAINVNGEYKTYDVNSGMLVNVADFVFDIGDDMFFVVPTNAVQRGDIILANDGPACVIDAVANEIKAFSFKTGTIVTIVPERYVFFGNTYFYSKIMSPFANMTKGDNPMEKMMPMMMMSQMTSEGGEFSKMMGMAMMMNGGMNFGDMFGGLFDGLSAAPPAAEPASVSEVEELKKALADVQAQLAEALKNQEDK